MPYIAYEDASSIRPATLQLIQQANQIAVSYQRRGYNLTLRQLYYQFVARDIIPNNEAMYKKLGRVVSIARRTGLMDWNHIEDRGRESYGTNWLGHVPNTDDQIIEDAQRHHSLDLWEGQEFRVEVWVEKQALEEVAQKATANFRTGYLACKGYMSDSEMWVAGRRLQRAVDAGQNPLILHLGDHDPSGIDMTRDIKERLELFAETEIDVRRIALNMNQIEDLNPPPNPAKVTDSRFKAYQDEYGSLSWELDAISPERLVELIGQEIENVLDRPKWKEILDQERKHRRIFDRAAEKWDEIVDHFDLNIDDED